MINRQLFWVSLLCVILITPLSLRAQNQTPPSEEFNVSPKTPPQGTDCQDAEAVENQRYKEVQLQIQIEQNDLNAKRQEELIDCQSQNQPECSNGVNDKYDRALRGIEKRAIEEQKTQMNKLLEISKTCLAQALPNPSKSPLPGNVSKNRFPDEIGRTDSGDSIPFPYPHLGSQEIIVKVDGDDGDGEIIEGKITQGPNPDQTKWVYRYAKGIVHRDPEDRNKDIFEIQELTDLNGNKYDAQHPIPVPNPPHPGYPFPIIIHLHPTGP